MIFLQIHVVRPGDTLYGLSQSYNLPIETIASDNAISDPSRLVVGQALVIRITGSYYWVSPGDSLYIISQRVNVPVDVLAQVNNIQNPNQLPVGLRLYIPPRPKPTKEVAAYIDTQTTRERTGEEVRAVGDQLTYLNIFSYAVDANGNLTPPNDEPAIIAAYERNVAPLMVLTNFADGTFSQEIAAAILNNPSLQDTLLANALSIMEEKGYRGIDFDFEYVGRENREAYNAFIAKAANFFQPNYFVSSALAPKLSTNQVGTLYEGHDYAAHGRVLDFVFLMTYEWGWSGGPPMAVSPLNEVRRVLEYAITQIPRNKIMMGIPLYGYDWTLPYVAGGQWAKVVSPARAVELALQYNARIEYDYTAQAPYFNYWDEQGREHVVWFEDARSIQAKFNLVKSLGIRGFFYWALGTDFPQNWLLIEDNFTVVKHI